MRIKNFCGSYNLHDSLIDFIEYDECNRHLTIQVDFAFWMQRGYVDTDPETGIIHIHFYDVTRYVCPSDIDFSKTSILEAQERDGELILLMLNDFTDEAFEIIIAADCVKVIINECC